MIKSCLQQWEIYKQNCMTTSNTLLHAWIQILFYQVSLEDKDMLHVLQAEDFDIDDQTLRRLHIQLDLWCCMMKVQQQTDEIIQKIQEELKQETIERYEKKLLHHHFKSKNLIVAQWVIQCFKTYKTNYNRNQLYSIYYIIASDAVK